MVGTLAHGWEGPAVHGGVVPHSLPGRDGMELVDG